MLISHYKANTEIELLSTLSDLSNILEKIDVINDKSIAHGGDFNLSFEAKLEVQGGNPVLKKNSLAKLILIKKNLICVIFGELETQTRRVILFVNNMLLVIFKEDLFTFSFISNVLLKSVKNPDVLAAFSTDHSPIIH